MYQYSGKQGGKGWVGGRTFVLIHVIEHIYIYS
jgi:hypothetical protein